MYSAYQKFCPLSSWCRRMRLLMRELCWCMFSLRWKPNMEWVDIATRRTRLRMFQQWRVSLTAWKDGRSRTCPTWSSSSTVRSPTRKPLWNQYCVKCGHCALRPRSSLSSDTYRLRRIILSAVVRLKLPGKLQNVVCDTEIIQSLHTHCLIVRVKLTELYWCQSVSCHFRCFSSCTINLGTLEVCTVCCAGCRMKITLPLLFSFCSYAVHYC